MIARNERGDVFEELIRGDEATLLGSAEHQPLTHALVVAQRARKYLFMLNRWKKVWEVPGGLIEPGESAKDCAERELNEETGQRVRELRFVGLMRFKLQPDGRIEFGALYAGELESNHDLASSDEAEAITLWDLESEIGEVDAIDRALVDFYSRTPPA